MIKNKSYTITNQLLNHDLLSSYITRFWDDVFSPILLSGADKHLMVMVKVSFNTPKFDYAYRTLGYLRSVNHSEKEQFTEYLLVIYYPIKRPILLYRVKRELNTNFNINKTICKL